jgi:hypothetical protein
LIFAIIPLVASALAALVKLPTRLLWLLVVLCLVFTLVPMQWWGLYHYWLGARHFEQLGYFDLYECSAAATGETTRRDLATYDFRFDQARCDLEPDAAASLAADLEAVNFDPRAMTDKGLNASPAWLAIGEPLSALPVELVVWLDPLALLAAFLVAGRLLGWRRVGYAALYLLTFYGAFNRLWGHYGQWGWLALLIIGVALIHTRRAWGGALIGAAGALMIFPVFLLIGRSRRIILWGAAGLVLMLGVGLLNSRGLSGYIEFVDNMRLHSAYVRTEVYNVGLGNTAAMLLNPETVASYQQCFTLGDCVESYQYRLPALWVLLVPLVAASSYGLIFGLLTLSRYYYLVLAVLPLEHSESRARMLLGVNALLFAWSLWAWDTVYTWGQLAWLLFFVSYWRSHELKTNLQVFLSTWTAATFAKSLYKQVWRIRGHQRRTSHHGLWSRQKPRTGAPPDEALQR